jgi:predicted Zn-dependent protease
MSAESEAVFYDGHSNRKRSVALRLSEALEMIEDGAMIARWDYADIRHADGGGRVRLRLAAANSLARLEITDAALAQEVIARCSHIDAAEGKGHVKRVVFWSLAAACSIVLVVTFIIPALSSWLAPLVPLRVEQQLGRAVDNQVRVLFGGKICTSQEGAAAFAKLVEKLRVAGALDAPLDAQIIDSKISNAMALPGGKIYLFRGMIEDAQHADEIAGVLAHELGHVRNRDGLRRLIQMGSTSFLIGLLFGDVTGSGAVLAVARSLFDASYSRENETDADTFSIDVMQKLGRSPTAMGELLVRITKKHEFGPTIFSTHPLSEDRLARMRQEKRVATGPELLTPQEWQALKDACKKP